MTPVVCNNTSPEILEHTLRVAAQFGRVVLRPAYGNHTTLANTWQEALVHLDFMPFFQCQNVPGKNRPDMALALDAAEVLFDELANTFWLVTSESDSAYLRRKLRERGGRVHIVGDAAALLSVDTSDGLVSISLLCAYPKRADPSFAPKKYGRASLLDLLRS